MAFLVGLLMFLMGLYLYTKKIRRDKVGISILNVYWKTKRNGFIFLLLFGGLTMIVRELILLFLE